MPSLQEQVKNLLALQDIDNHISVLTEEKEEGPRRMAQLQENLDKCQTVLTAAQAELDSLESEKEELDQKISEVNRKTRKSQGKIADIKNPRMHQAVLQELEDLKALKEDAEEKLLLSMDDLERTKARVEQYTAEAEELEKELEAERIEYDAHKNKLTEDLKRLTKEREGLAAKIPFDTLDEYDFIRERLGDPAVAVVVDGACQMCHIYLTPQQYNELRRLEDLMRCPSCSRLIYWADYDA